MTEYIDKAENLTDIKLLIVDDNHLNVDILRRTLEPEGYSISVAFNGETALNIAPRFIPDLILLDIMMPEIDGFETCRRLKKEEKTQDIPIIFITAKNETDDIVKGLRMGAVDYITKPFCHEEVSARVRTHIKNRILMRQLEVKNRRLAEINDLKSKFLSIVAHDLRNPLISVQGFSSLMLRKMDSSSREDKEKFLTSINSCSKSMLNLVNNLLDVLVVESGNLELNLIRSSLKELVQRRVEINKIIASRKSIEIKEELMEPIDVTLDPHRVAQVIDNLLSNAIKFSSRGSNVYINVERDGNMAKVSVRDEGPGISKEDLAKVCRSFQKLTARPTAGERSTGLGLAIAKKMINAHKGMLDVTSELGVGSTFSFVLPMDEE